MRYWLMSLSILLSGCVVPVAPTEQAGVPMPIIIDVPDQIDSRAVHICTLKPFTQEYRSEHSSRGRAKLNVQKQCLANHSDIFCEEKDIVCKTYY
ncbi:hypothetical protein MHD_06120 [Mannheimia granulomatis]|uniref:Lipoprotein n=1 Tax=Mannheimia granulomatis TaxID=85402 RepID=A0A011NDS9_9PAST|nr:hypothetical protein [Mannheimia granulomatis]EXI62712.1 hypothetical protein AK33_02860 [Mannheimia granulomatis]RGE48053.1 hypothetical protein MHD_06120 [Mannheimia granulomatis]